MSVNVDAVNERLNGLVTLLQAVGVDSLDKGEVDRVSKNFSKDGGVGGIPDARQLDDSQIEAIIKKLQQAQEEAPQIIAALEAHAEARSLTGERKSSKQQKQPQHQQQQEEQEEEEEDEEEDEEYDEDGNYPMVGPGCSDDCSVMSDLTTPTVVSSVHVPDEEHYRDNTLPPMIIGGGGGGAPAMVISAPKRKNLVSQVGRQSGQQRRGAPAPRSGAAASRRKNYQSTMAKLHENPNGMGHSGPTTAPRTKPSSRSTGSRPPSSSGSSKKRVPKSRGTENFSDLAGHSSTRSGADWDVPEQGGWDNFESKPKSPSKGAAPTMIDDDGFLVGGSFDPFNTGAAPAKAKSPFKSSAGDLEYARARSSRDGFSGNASSNGFGSSGGGGGASGSGSGPPRKTRPRKPHSSSSGQGQPVRRERPTGAPSNGAPPGRVRRSRRASAL